MTDDPDAAASFISWDDARAFCKRLTNLKRALGRIGDDQEYRLPTETEWEYACRAGTDTIWSFGNDEAKLGEYAWFGGERDNITGALTPGSGNKSDERHAHPVGRKKPNSWGLHDMHGNVSEWCLEPSSPHLVPNADLKAVTRGGGWSLDPCWSRSAWSYFTDKDSRRDDYGFRVVLTPASPGRRAHE